MNSLWWNELRNKALARSATIGSSRASFGLTSNAYTGLWCMRIEWTDGVVIQFTGDDEDTAIVRCIAALMVLQPKEGPQLLLTDPQTAHDTVKEKPQESPQIGKKYKLPDNLGGYFAQYSGNIVTIKANLVVGWYRVEENDIVWCDSELKSID